MSDQLVEFLRTKRDRSPGPSPDWEAKRDSWIRSVGNLYRRVRDLLKDPIDEHVVTVREVDIEIAEELIGTYKIPALELTVGNERVAFRPKGVTVIGASGRVDIRGDRDTVTLIKDEPSEESDWSVVLDRVPRVRTAKLDRESLREALERAMAPLA